MDIGYAIVVETDQNVICASRTGKEAERDAMQFVTRRNLLSKLAQK
jgi:hypothetical protein